MEINISYTVSFGKGDGTEDINWNTVELTEEQEKLFKEAVRRGDNPEDIPEIQKILDDAYKDIERNEKDNLDSDDDFVNECLGKVEVDPDEINELVSERDQHTLEFFNLTELSEEELDNWDANDLEDLPYVCDFDEDFEPESPFDYWDIYVHCSWNDEDI